jgi:DNA-directed RNA polymerase specialized sigma24 family protein
MAFVDRVQICLPVHVRRAYDAGRFNPPFSFDGVCMSTFFHPDPPSSEEGLFLHRRLLEDDPAAPADLAARYLPPLRQWLLDNRRDLDPHLCETAAHIALVDLIKRPARFDPEHLSLDAFLRMAAHRDLLNLRQQESRHHRGRRDWNVVADDDDGGNILGRDEDPSLRLQIEEAEQALADRVEAIADGWTPVERRALELILAGRSSTEELAPELGLSHLPPERIRDRVCARYRRAGDEHE